MKFGLKIPNRFGKMSEKNQGDSFDSHTVQASDNNARVSTRRVKRESHYRRHSFSQINAAL